MDTTRFKEVIKEFTDPDCLSVSLDFLIHTEEGYRSFTTNPDDDMKEEMIKGFATKLNSLAHLGDFQISDIYDDNASPAEITLFFDAFEKNEIAKTIFGFERRNLTPFDFTQTSMSELYGIIIELDNGQDKIKLFKKTYPIQVVKERTTHNFFWDQGSLKLFKKDLFQLNDKIHLIGIGDEVVIVAKKIYLDHFGFKEKLKEQSAVHVAAIQASGHFEVSERVNAGTLSQSYQKKLKSCIEKSPIYRNKNFTDLQKHTSEYGGRDIKMTDTGFFKIGSKKDLIALIDFLNRDFNKNEVTGEVFKTDSKKLVRR